MLAKQLTPFLCSLLFAVSLLAAGCQTAPPVQEMSDARQAIMAAEAAGAAAAAASDYQEALEFLKAAETALNERAYLRARNDAMLAKSKALEALARAEAESESEQ